MIATKIFKKKRWGDYFTSNIYSYFAYPSLFIPYPKIIGKDNIKAKQNYIVASNHMSYFDIPLLLDATGRGLRFMGKKSLKKQPFIGSYIKAFGMVLIDRSSKESRKKSITDCIKKVKEREDLLLFPEGRRNDGKTLLPFKSGVGIISKESGIPILPIAIEGTQKLWARKTRILRYAKLKVRIGDPIDPSGKSIKELNDTLFETINTLWESLKK